MKSYLVLSTLIIPIVSTTPSTSTFPENLPTPEQVIESIPEPEIIVSYELTINDLIDALIFIESSGRENAIGDTNLRTPSIGVLQIRQNLVKDVNRIQKRNKRPLRYTYDDRFSREKSIEMFMIWHNHYHTNSNFEKIARCWNGGPRGWKKNQTIQYWIKVNKELNFPPPELMVSDNIDDGSI